MSGLRSRNKGKRGERELANLLQDEGYDARRGQQYHGGGDSPDVVGVPGVHFEVKRCERLSVYKAMEQAQSESKPDEVPVVAHRRNGQPWVVVMLLDDWIGMKRKGVKS